LQPAPQVDPIAVAFLRAAGCVYAEDEARILTEAARSSGELKALLDRRAAGEPLEYIVGWAEYCGLRIPLCSGVFVPRRRSEFLAECAMDVVSVTAARRGGSQPVRVLDMCCGSGAIGLAVAIRFSGVELLAADDSTVAVGCARENLAQVSGRVYQGDLFAALPRTQLHTLDLIVANAPHVPTAEIQRLPAEARLYEPLSTLDGGPDGTSVQKRILESAAEWLRPPGVVLIETAEEMAELTMGIAREAGFTPQIRVCADLDATIMTATRPA
jgi:release factor glutamine methyltransferase